MSLASTDSPDIGSGKRASEREPWDSSSTAEGVATTRAGDGYERRAFSADEIWRMQDLGIIDDDEGFELIEGDIVMMQFEERAARAHQARPGARFGKDPARHSARSVSRRAWCLAITRSSSPTFRSSRRWIRRAYAAPTCSSPLRSPRRRLRKDLKLKADALCAKYGIRRILGHRHPQTLTTTVHKAPVRRGLDLGRGPDGGRDPWPIRAHPGFAIRLARPVAPDGAATNVPSPFAHEDVHAPSRSSKRSNDLTRQSPLRHLPRFRLLTSACGRTARERSQIR